MRVWVDVDAPDVDGPIDPISASVNRSLDGIGTLSLSILPTDRRTLTLLQNERRFSVYVEEADSIRLLGKGIVRKIDKKVSGTSWTYTIDSPDSTDVLKDYTTFRNLIYNDQTIESIVTDLLSKAGWTAVVESGLGNANGRFDGSSIFKAIAAITKQNGIHFREGANPNELEIGAFGASSGLRITNVPVIGVDAMDNDEIALITSLTQTTQSDDLLNYAIPLGDGQGESALTLEKAISYRSIALGFDYDITPVVKNGKTEYAIIDPSSSINMKQRYLSLADIGVNVNSDTAIIASACQLYDAAVAEMKRRLAPTTSYKVSGVKCRQTLKPGDTVWLDYTGDVLNTDGDFLTFVSVNQAFNILKVTEKVSTSGVSFDLDISTVDVMPKDAVDKLIEAKERIELRNLKPGLTTFGQTYSRYDYVQNWSPGGGQYVKHATFNFKVDSKFTDIFSISLSFMTSPLEATVYCEDVFDTGASLIPRNAFQVITDTRYPNDVSLWIDGVDVSSHFDGPWEVGGTGLNPVEREDLNITDLLKAAGLFQKHVIQVRCGARTGQVGFPGFTFSSPYASHGRVDIDLTVIGTLQGIK